MFKSLFQGLSPDSPRFSSRIGDTGGLLPIFNRAKNVFSISGDNNIINCEYFQIFAAFVDGDELSFWKSFV